MKTFISSLSKDLSPLLIHVQQLRGINRVLQTVLPAHLRDRVEVANWRQGTLVLISDQAAATELRFLQQELIDRCRLEAQMHNLRRIEVKVGQPDPIETHHDSTHLPVKSSICQDMEAVAAQIDDPALQTALIRLASTLRQKHSPDGTR